MSARTISFVAIFAATYACTPTVAPRPDPESAATPPTADASLPETNAASPKFGASWDAGNDANTALPPLMFAVGDKTIVVEQHKNKPGPLLVYGLALAVVDRVRFDDVTVFPAECSAKPILPKLCDPSFEVKEGLPYSTVLVGSHQSGDVVTLLFAALYIGSPECGAYGFWLLRFGPKTMRATTLYKDCFSFGPDAEDPSQRTPTMKWAPPMALTAIPGSLVPRTTKVDEKTFDWIH